MATDPHNPSTEQEESVPAEIVEAGKEELSTDPEEIIVVIDEEPLDGRDAESKKKSLKRTLTFVFTAALVFFAIIYAELFPHLTQYFYMYAESYTMYFTGIGVFLVFLNFPFNKKKSAEFKDKIIIPDLILGCIALVSSFYVGLNFESIYSIPTANTMECIMGWAMIVVTMEAARRSIGLPMVVVAFVFLLYIFFGSDMPGFLRTISFAQDKIVKYIYLSTEGIFGMPSQIVSTTVIAFITFGAFLACSKAGSFYKNLALAAVGALQGGAAKAAIVCSCLFATMTGEPVSNSGIVGPLTLPLMKNLKYDKVFSAAAVATASCGSMIMPPVMAAVAFMMGQFTGLGYAAVVTAAILPAILYYCALYFQIDFFTAKQKYPSVPRTQLPSIKKVMKEGWQYIIPIIVLVYFLLVLRWTPAGAIYRSLGVLILIVLCRKDDRIFFFTRLKKAIFDSGFSALPTIAVSSAAGIIMASVTMTGFGLKLSAFLGVLANGNLLILAILAAVTIYIMGMGMAPIVSYILMAILVAPAMVQLGVPVIAAHFFILYMSVSAFITPPFALASYMCAGMVGVDGLKVCFKAMRLGIACFLIPFVSIFSPQLLGLGNPLEVFWCFITALVGVFLIAAALEGYMFGRAPAWQRILFAAAGIILFIPGLNTDIIGFALAIVPFLLQLRLRKQQKLELEQAS